MLACAGVLCPVPCCCSVDAAVLAAVASLRPRRALTAACSFACHTVLAAFNATAAASSATHNPPHCLPRSFSTTQLVYCSNGGTSVSRALSPKVGCHLTVKVLSPCCS